MNYHTLRIIALTTCLYAGHTYSMDKKLEIISENKDILELSDIIAENNNNGIDTFDAEYDKQQVIEAKIKQRKFCNVVAGVMTLSTMGLDILNSCFPEGSLLTHETQQGHFPCICSNNETICVVQNGLQKDICEPKPTNNMLFSINTGLPLWRIPFGFMNLYYLYQAQQTLNSLSITEGTKETSSVLRNLHVGSAGVLGGIATIAGIMNGIKNYPLSILNWAFNANNDIVCAINWQENIHACDELSTLISEAQLEDVTIHNEDVTSENYKK